MTRPGYGPAVIDARDNFQPTFNPPPGWPAPPAGWVPPEGWLPDATWPEPPDGWVFWVTGPAPAAGTQQSAPSDVVDRPWMGAPAVSPGSPRPQGSQHDQGLSTVTPGGPALWWRWGGMVLAIVIGAALSGVSGAFILTSLVIGVVGVVGLVRSRVRWAFVTRRLHAAAAVGLAVVGLSVGGAVAGPSPAPPREASPSPTAAAALISTPSAATSCGPVDVRGQTSTATGTDPADQHGHEHGAAGVPSRHSPGPGAGPAAVVKKSSSRTGPGRTGSAGHPRPRSAAAPGPKPCADPVAAVHPGAFCSPAGPLGSRAPVSRCLPVERRPTPATAGDRPD